MPPVAAAIAAIGTAFISTVGSAFMALGFTAGTAGFLAGTILRIGIGLALGYVMRALSPKPDVGAIDQGQELTLKFDAAYPREIVVGTAATGGSMVFAQTTGAKREFLWRVVALSDCEIDSVTEVWGDGQKLTFSGDWHSTYATCTSHYKSTGGTARLSIRIYKGTATQTYDTTLAGACSEITSTFRGLGVAYAIIRCEFDPDAFPGGEPRLMFIVKGAKILDPRTGTTAWTANAALVAKEAMRGFQMNGVRVVGLGCSASDVPDAQVAVAADACDEAVTLSAGGTEARYQANGVLSAAETAREIITNLTAAMAGRHIDRGGEVIFLPGVARTPVLALTDADILADAPITYAQKQTADRLINTMVSTFVDPASAWQENALPVRKDTSAIAADGDRFVARRGYRFVTSRTQGQRLDMISLKEARQQARASVTLPLWALELEPGDWITWTSARFTGVKTFVVEGLQLAISSDASAPSARVQVALAEIDASVFAWSTSDEISGATVTVARATPPKTLQGAPSTLTYQAPLTRSPASILSSADVAGAARISIAAHTDTGAGGTVSRNAGTISGLSYATGYHVWANDPGTPYGAGGAVTYVAATSLSTYVDSDDHKWLGFITTVAAGGGGGGYVPPTGNDCVAALAWLNPRRRAIDVGPGDLIDALTEDGRGVEAVEVEGSRIVYAQCVRLVSDSGIMLTCSRMTPVTQPDGRTIWAHEAKGAAIAVEDAGGFRWETIARVDCVGEHQVARIHCHGRTYGAGDVRGRRMFTHNPIKP